MGDDLQGNLQNYKLQLQQVEAALTTDPDNQELHKLKIDLEEVIELTVDLIKTQLLELKAGAGIGDDVDDETLTQKLLSAEVSLNKSKCKWKVGDKCMAIWSGDGQYYEATIESFTENGQSVNVAFDSYQHKDVTSVSMLQPIKKKEEDKNKKIIVQKLREYQKKKKQKKLQRYKQLEEEREGEKNKWLAFSGKSVKKGFTKKSIFASPDNVNGRVGIGTCGMSGKPMTEFTSAEKWRKGV